MSGDVVVDHGRLHCGETGLPHLIPRRRRELPPQPSFNSPAGRSPAMQALLRPSQAHLFPIEVCPNGAPLDNSGDS